eukprot:TRINITY_DN3775_c1_g1_i1.p1 TRINITY_DN3775_c1_g1~~TRINITY_DN3775_c1_g1_i1.p1  ORF type:complete len:265 (+),score=63.48 TRINITY_DN3775_c1_g1_i1:3-797(+)
MRRATRLVSTKPCRYYNRCCSVNNSNWNVSDRRRYSNSNNGSAAVEKRVCWSCNDAIGLNSLVCGACTKIQPPPSAEHLNYFQMFASTQHLNVPSKMLTLNSDDLKKNVFDLQKKLHPDLIASNPKYTQDEKNYSQLNSALVNEAWKILRDESERVRYILKLYKRVDLLEEGVMETNGSLLQEMMDVRERLDDERVKKNHGDSSGWDEIKRENDIKIRDCMEKLRNIFQEEEKSVSNKDKMVKELSNLVHKLQYLERIGKELDQ